MIPTSSGLREHQAPHRTDSRIADPLVDMDIGAVRVESLGGHFRTEGIWRIRARTEGVKSGRDVGKPRARTMCEGGRHDFEPAVNRLMYSDKWAMGMRLIRSWT
jgi:hypothetical protein